jgi:hypothetical protein
LGVVFDGRTNTAAVSPLARMCERAGIDTVWIADPFAGTALSGDLDAWLMAADLLRTLSTSSVGVMIDSRRGTADLIELVANRMHQGPGGRKRLELNLPDSGGEPRDAQRLRDELSAVGIDVRLSALARSGTELGSLLGMTDDIVLSAWQTPDLETAADEARAAAMDAGRDPASLGVAALVPVSVGRTDAEAAARAGMDPDFTRFGHPAEIGIFGTLEECQDRVIALAHAGITDLRCVLPATPDVHDVIAQLTAISMGTVDVLLPGSLRSPAPPPPEGWGGRPDRPPSRRVSDGSRRRR